MKLKTRLAAAALTVTAAIVAVPVGAASAASASTYPGPLPCSPTKIDNLTYRGGIVEDLPLVNLIFWGSWWITSPKAPAVVTELQNLFKGLTGSSWAQTITQYCDDSGASNYPQVANFTSGASTLLAGSFFDPYDPPPAPTDQEMTDEAGRAMELILSEWPPGTEGDMPVVVTPPGVAPASDAANGWCGSHGAGEDTSGTWSGEWADVPYGLIASNPRCQPDGSPAEGLSLVAGHEWAETATDPNGSMWQPGILPGWAAAVSATESEEIADLCTPDQTDLSGKSIDAFWLKLPTGKFWMQQLWSNEAGPSRLQGKCVKGS